MLCILYFLRYRLEICFGDTLLHFAHFLISICILSKCSFRSNWTSKLQLRFLSIFKHNYLKNGKSYFKNFTTLQIANLILYNFYFMQICHIFTPKALKLEKTKTCTYIHFNSCSFICMCVCPVNPKCQADILKEYESCDGTGFYGSAVFMVRFLLRFDYCIFF